MLNSEKLQYDTPLHEYAVMLHERVEKCEDNVAHLERVVEHLKNTVHRFVKYKYFKVEYEVALSTRDRDGDGQRSETLWDVKNRIMDEVFCHRRHFLPTFAYIKWTSNDTTFALKTYIIVQEPVSLLQMQEWIPRAKSVQNFEGVYGELKALVKNDIGYYSSMPTPHDDIGAELWTLGGDKIDFDLEVKMTEDAFTQSTNYCDAFALQCALHEHVKYKNWFELFGLE